MSSISLPVRRSVVVAACLLVSTLLVAAAPSADTDAAHPGPNGPVAFAHIDGRIIIAQPGDGDASRWQEVINPPVAGVMLDEPSISPDGRWVAFQLIGPFATDLYVYNRSTRQVARVDGGMAGPASWTPDGGALIYSVTDGSDLLRKVVTIGIDGGGARILAEIPTGETAIAPAGDQILYWDDVDDVLGLLDVATGEQRVVFESGTGGVIIGQSLSDTVVGSNPPAPFVNKVQLNWAPDSQSFVFNCGFVDSQGENNGFLCSMRSDGTDVRLLTGGRFSGRAVAGSFTPQGDQILFSAFVSGGLPRIWVMPATGIDASETGVVQFSSEASLGASHLSPDVGVPFGTTPTPASSITATPLPSTSGGPTSPPTPPSNAVDITSLTPARLLETRDVAGAMTIDGEFEGSGRVGATGVIELDVLGRGGVPQAGVKSVVLNITAVNPTQRGFLTVYPCETRPNASSLNYEPGANRASEVIAKVSDAGTVCLYTHQSSHLIADVTGYVPDGSDFSSVTPARLLDTRANGDTIDDLAQRGGKVGEGRVVEVQVTGRGGVPGTGVSSAVLNVTAVAGERNGFLTVFACDDLPNASALNYRTNNNVANEVIAELSADGTVCVFSRSTAHVIVDVTGYTRSGSDVTAIAPARLLETRVRAGLTTIDGEFEGGGALEAMEIIELEVEERGGVPDGAAAVVLNITAVGADAKGFFTVYPCGTLPLASSLNYEANTSTANEVVAKLSAGGNVCIFTQARAHVLVDVTGYVSAAA